MNWGNSPTCATTLQWDKVENKTGVVLYGAGAVVLVWFSSTLVTALNSIPLVCVWARARARGELETAGAPIRHAGERAGIASWLAGWHGSGATSCGLQGHSGPVLQAPGA
jgi:hypothetical protein